MNFVVHYKSDKLIGLALEYSFLFPPLLLTLCFGGKFWSNMAMHSSTSFLGREFVSDFNDFAYLAYRRVEGFPQDVKHPWNMVDAFYE